MQVLFPCCMQYYNTLQSLLWEKFNMEPNGKTLLDLLTSESSCIFIDQVYLNKGFILAQSKTLDFGLF